MSVVAFDRIQKVLPNEVVEPSTPKIGTLNHSERPDLYDPIFGYFLFSQSVGFQVNEAKAYNSQATFTIHGTFTHDAEKAVLGVTTEWSDTEAFNALVAKYTALEQMFDAASNAAEPADYALWGTDLDPRCIQLPAPLVDKDGHPIWAFATNLQVEPDRWTQKLSYVATLKEAKMPRYKIKVNNTLLDAGILNITLPAPILFRKRLVGCTGEVMQMQNYTCTEYEVTGQLFRRKTDPALLSQKAVELVRSLEDNDVHTISLVSSEGTTPLYSNLHTDNGNSVESNVENLQDGVSLKFKALR